MGITPHMRRLGKLAACLSIGIALQGSVLTSPSRAQNLSAYTDPYQLYYVPFGYRSHWLQPWRAYLETMPASRLVNGIGVQINPSSAANPDLVVQMLAKHGIRHVRIEIGWSSLTYDETGLSSPTSAQALLVACKKYGVRPLILLNANQGGPTPLTNLTKFAAQTAPAGSTTLALTDTSGLTVGRSGLSNVTEYWAAEILITGISGNTVTLSKPLPSEIASGTSLTISTLKYRPFSPSTTTDYQETVAAWNNYASTVASFVASSLGTTGLPDLGFDMEIWNELSFGSAFLDINNYYNPALYSYDSEAIWGDLIDQTTTSALANPGQFSGVGFGDGIANTIPWPASSTEPETVGAIDKHPYVTRAYFNTNGYGEPPNTPVNALGQIDTSGFGPAYTILFPESAGSAIATETLIRDMAPLNNTIYGGFHGRNARVLNGLVVPCWVWVTESNVSPSDNGVTDVNTALNLKAKNALRSLAFYLNKGGALFSFFNTDGGDLNLGMVLDSFLQYSTSSSVYPSSDTSYTSPALAAIGRMSQQFQTNLDSSLTTASTRPLTVTSITDTHNHYQFTGDGTSAHPNLYNRNVFAFLPFQANSSRFVIPYYVITRDITQDLPPEQYTVTVSGLKGLQAQVSAYDPLKNVQVSVSVTRRTANSLTLQLTATDYPYLLTVQEKTTSSYKPLHISR